MNIPSICDAQANPNDIHMMVITTYDETYDRILEYVKIDSKIKIFRQKGGIEAVTTFRHHGLDVVIIDVSDPEENWPITITRIRKIDAHAMIIMVSDNHLGEHPGSKTNGLERGAAEYFDIPARHSKIKDITLFKNQLTRTIRALSAARRELGETKAPPGPPIKRDEKRRLAQLKAAAPIPVTLRPYRNIKPDVIAIASSTGGPHALAGFIGGLPRTINCPIIITQHMLKGFTDSLVSGITKNTDWPCQEGIDGSELLPGNAYMAPSDHHMVFKAGAPYPRIRLIDTPPENFCKPSADPMFRSVVEIYGPKVLAIVLTGMGIDGLSGAKEVIKAGGNVIAQDQESSVVWGMPRAVAEAGLCAAIMPIDALPSEAARIVQGNFPK